MLKEVIEYIFKEARDGANPRPHVESIGPRAQRVTLNGVMDEFVLPRQTMSRSVTTIESLVALATEFGGNNVTIFCNEEEIVCVLDDDDRTETVRLPLEHSKQFNIFRHLEAGMGQKELVRTLRTSLAGCVQYEDIVPLFRQIQFGVHRGAGGEAGHQRQSLGRSVEMEVAAKAGEIPEEVRVRLPLFTVPGDVNTDIDFLAAIDIDIEKERVCLIPVGDAIADKTQEVVGRLRDRIIDGVGDDVIVVFGETDLR